MRPKQSSMVHVRQVLEGYSNVEQPLLNAGPLQFFFGFFFFLIAFLFTRFFLSFLGFLSFDGFFAFLGFLFFAFFCGRFFRCDIFTAGFDEFCQIFQCAPASVVNNLEKGISFLNIQCKIDMQIHGKEKTVIAHCEKCQKMSKAKVRFKDFPALLYRFKGFQSLEFLFLNSMTFRFCTNLFLATGPVLMFFGRVYLSVNNQKSVFSYSTQPQ